MKRAPIRAGGMGAGFCMAVLAAFGGESGGLRDWESADGRMLEARILWRTGETVRMERADGEVFDIPVDRFSEESRAAIRAWEPPPIAVPAPDDAVLVLETGEGRGSGFLVQEEGRVWVYTNQHVIADGRSVRAVDTNGAAVPLGEMEIAADRDLARFATTVRKGLLLAEGGATGDAVSVYGNSQGAGVITRSDGEILGVAPGTFEVSSEIVSGNSGGPVLDAEGRVLAVSSFVRFDEAVPDPTTLETRYESPRRFALRLDQKIPFRSVGRGEFAGVYGSFRAQRDRFDEALDLTRTILAEPTDLVMEGNFSVAEVAEIAEDHNRDVERLPQVADSGMSFRSKVRKIRGRLLNTLEDAVAVGEDALEQLDLLLTDERFGWMRSETERRRALLDRWKETIAKVERSFD